MIEYDKHYVLMFGQYCNIFENKIFCNIHSCNITAQAQANVCIIILNIYYTTFMDDVYTFCQTIT